MFKDNKTPRHVPNAKDNELRPGDPMGSFVGYLRRPKSTASGLIAQFFGENGPDADVIAALHLTRFLDAYVKVTVWMIKDSQGKIMKENGQYRKLTEFIGIIRRPQPSNIGQVAQFFGENGVNADAVNVLNQSSYLDALVYVEMHSAMAGMTVNDLNTPSPKEKLEENLDRMTTTEANEFKKLQKKSQEALRTLTLTGFFRQESVLSALGRETDYAKWLETQWCCNPGEKPCDNQPVIAWSVPGVSRYGFIPLCSSHAEDWSEGKASTVDGTSPLSFAQSQAISSLQRWALFALSQQLKIPQNSIPTPGAIYSWAVDKKVANFIPNTFKAMIGEHA